MSDSLKTPALLPENEVPAPGGRFRWVGWSSFLFAIVQSVCTTFVALSGLRLILGAAAFSSAVGVMKMGDKQVHFDAIRVPMMILALVGALFNLVALWQVRRLRARSASAWRQKPVSRARLNSEWLQFSLSILTLLLLAAEYWYHRKILGG